MPFYLHAQNTPPDSGTPYPDKASAVANRRQGQTISFLCSEAERETWQQREMRRLLDKTYTILPWQNEESYPQTRYRPLHNGIETASDFTPFADHSFEECNAYYQVARYHYAHVSLRSDAMIAYTPSDEHGHADRQVRIRCGKYLDLVAPFLLPVEKDKLCAMIRSMASATFKLATTPADIRAVYRYGQGFASCMDSRNFSCDDDQNPVSVYGDSDLAVAYLGDIHSDDPRVTARVLVWPEKKIYTRVYGDELIACLLRQDGWQYGDWEDDSPLTGARIRAIRIGQSGFCYVMPYIDAANTVSLTSDGKYFELCDNDDPGDYNAKETCGRIGHAYRECDHCGNQFRITNDDDTECNNCQNQWECDGCHGSFYPDEDRTGVRTYRRFENYHSYCERCTDRLSWQCERCDTLVWPCQFSPTMTAQRSADNLTDYCMDCAEIILAERADEEDDTDTDTPSVSATDASADVVIAPLPAVLPSLSILGELKVYECGHTCNIGSDVQILRREQSITGDNGTIWIHGDCKYFNLYPNPEHGTARCQDFLDHATYTIMRSPEYGRYSWLRLKSARFQDLPVGTPIRVPSLPHHTGVKTGPNEIRWNACPPGMDCSYPERVSSPTPTYVYEVNHDAL